MPSSTPIYRLSQDLIDEIIDVLVTIDELESEGHWYKQWKGLNAYALISHAFLPRCNSYMFKRIDFNTDSLMDQRSRCKALHEILKNRPMLADYVQEVNISLSFQHDTAWIIEDNAFLGVMRMLEKSRSPLQNFRLFGDSQYPSRPFHEAPQFVQQVAKPVIFPFITFLYLKDLYDIPVEMVESCIHLTHLVLFNVKFTSRAARPSGSSVPRLNKLDYRNSADGIGNFLANGCEAARIDLSDLRTFIVGIDNLADIRCAQDVLNMSPSLEDLFLIHSSEHGE